MTVLVPWVEPKLEPEIVTSVPSDPDEGLRPLRAGFTVKLTPLLATPATVTTTLPVVAPAGTGTTIPVPLQNVGDPAVPLNVTVLVPCVDPNPVPLIVTEVPTVPDKMLRLVMLGTTENATPLLALPPTVTTTLPLVAAFGTGRVIRVSNQLVGAAGVPLKVIVLVPCAGPKPKPLTLMEVPTFPEAGVKLLMDGITVNVKPLLAIPPTVTTTGPVSAPGPATGIGGPGTVTTMLVALQLAMLLAKTPLKVRKLLPWVAPKLAPVMVTEVPTVPELGLRLVIVGGSVTVKATPLLARPLTVTTTLPVVAPAGTGTRMLVLPQLAGVAAVPLNVTVLAP